MDHKWRWLAAGLAVVFSGSILCGCGQKNENFVEETANIANSQGSETVRLVQAEYPVKEYKNDEERFKAQRELRIGEEFSERLKTFGYETAGPVLGDSLENGMYSPLSLYLAVAMATAGAQGNTEAELLELLGYESQDKLKEDCQKAFVSFYQNDEIYKFQIASSVWADDSVSLKEPFLNDVKEYYFADVYQVDFADEQTGQEMTQWVKERTVGLIEPSFELNAQQILSLINTIYYYNQWQDQFDESKTTEGIFTCADGTEVTCDYMNRTMGSHGYHRGDNYTVSSIPCKNGRMKILLPDRGTDLLEFLRDSETLNDALNSDTEAGEVIWQVPKFSYSSDYRLNDVLKDLGVEDAFSPENADFSSITDSQAWIDTILQQTHIGIDENGIEAAAFTEIMLAGGAMPTGRAKMILDRPFLYVIEYQGCPIFIGVCGNPADAS